MLPNVYNNHNYSPKYNEKMIYCQQAVLPPPKRLTLVKLNSHVWKLQLSALNCCSEAGGNRGQERLSLALAATGLGELYRKASNTTDFPIWKVKILSTACLTE